MPADVPASAPDPAASPRRRQWRTLSIRGLLILVALVALPLGFKARRASVQRRAVAAIKHLGGQVLYDWQVGPSTPLLDSLPHTDYSLRPGSANPPGPAWLRRWLGDEYFQDVIAVELSPLFHDDRPPLPPDSLADESDPTKLLEGVAKYDEDLRHHADALRRREDALVADQLACLDGLDRLRRLELVCLPLDRIGRGRLARLASLESLDVFGPADADLLATLGGMPRLRELALGHLDGVTPIDPLPHLRKLAVFNRPDGPTLDWIARHRDLECLTLDDEAIGDEDLAHLAGLTHLSGLTLAAATTVTDAGLAHLAGMAALQDLAIDQSPGITDAGLVTLAKLPRLRFASLHEARITAEGLAAFQVARPGIKVFERINNPPASPPRGETPEARSMSPPQPPQPPLPS